MNALARALLVVGVLVGVATSPVGAIVHAYQHDRPVSQKKAPHDAGRACELCAAFAALDHSAAAPLPLAILAAAPLLPLVVVATGIVARTSTPYFERGPPRLSRIA